MSEPMSPMEARRVAANHVIAELLSDPGPQWENYPDIGEADWAVITAIVGARIPVVRLDSYHRAYELLAALTDDNAEPTPERPMSTP